MTPAPGATIPRFTWTFNIETLRLMAYSALVFMVAVGIVVTKLFVHDDPTHTVIYRIFGFNHICNVFDHQPSRTVSGLLILLFIVPMAAFVICSYYRTYAAAREGRVPMLLHTYSKIITPFVFLAVCYTYMWFVNSPDDPAGWLGGSPDDPTAGFIPHYLPYVALQLALGLLAIHEVGWLIANGALPFGSSITLAKTYLYVLLGTTVLCQTAVFSLLLGFPILDSPNDPTERLLFQILMYFYSFLAIAMPIFFASRNRRNTLLNTITFT
jgi:hypothetical protein